MPRFVEPTVVAYHGGATGPASSSRSNPLADLDYSIGNEALAGAAGAALCYPMRGGLISDFDAWCGPVHAYTAQGTARG